MMDQIADQNLFKGFEFAKHVGFMTFIFLFCKGMPQGKAWCQLPARIL